MKITKEQVLDLVNGLNKSFDYKYTALKEPDTSSYAIIVDTRTKCNSYVARIYDDGSLHPGNFYDSESIRYIRDWLSTIILQTDTPHIGCECVPKEWLNSNDDNSSELDQMLVDTAKSLNEQIEDNEKGFATDEKDSSKMSNSLLDIVKYLDEKNYREKMTK